jgi:hypothetical protein
MFNKLLGRVEGVDSWLVASLIIFATFFVGVLVYLMLIRSKHVDYLKNIPFNEENEK